MKVVLDTNIWLSSVFWEGEADKLIKTIFDKKIKIIVTKEILFEISKVLNRETKFQKFITDRRIVIEDLLKTILSLSILIIPKRKVNIIKEDPSDNMILEAAIEGKAEYIISYDNHLLKLKEFEDIKIMMPKDFLKRIKRGFNLFEGIGSFTKKNKLKGQLEENE